MIPEVAGQVRHNPLRSEQSLNQFVRQSAVRADIDVSFSASSLFFSSMWSRRPSTLIVPVALLLVGGLGITSRVAWSKDEPRYVCASLPYAEREGGERQRERERESLKFSPWIRLADGLQHLPSTQTVWENAILY
jgi:hypothetical protein